MTVCLDKRDLAKYPFLKEAQHIVREMGVSLDALIKSDSVSDIKEKALERVTDAIASKYTFNEEIDTPDTEILSYGIARLIVSCMGDRAVMERLSRYEAIRAHFFFQEETHQKKAYIASSLGIDLDADAIPVRQYIELSAHLRDDRWRLINRKVQEGIVCLEKEEHDELVRERIRTILQQQLPLEVPGTVCLRLKPYIEQVSKAYQEKILEDFGEVDEGCFPPCIHALIAAVTAGTNIPHTGRFALTAFLHTIGMHPTQIVEVFTRAPDFDLSKTVYQVEHISGRSGTEYTPPSCATMRTYGLCVNRDRGCERVQHPLSYYRNRKKKEQNKPEKSA